MLKNGAPTRTRTADLLITNQLLYQLSYRGSDAVITVPCETVQEAIVRFFQETLRRGKHGFLRRH